MYFLKSLATKNLKRFTSSRRSILPTTVNRDSLSLEEHIDIGTNVSLRIEEEMVDKDSRTDGNLLLFKIV